MTWRAAPAALIVAVLAGCAHMVTGSATWPGDRLQAAVLTESDFPDGVRYEPIVREHGQGGDANTPPPMLSTPEGCTDALTRDIAFSAEWGPGSAAEYVVAYDGARMVITVLTWPLDLERLAATAERCAAYKTFFDPSDSGIAMTTTRIDTARRKALVYEQTMHLAGGRSGGDSSVYFSFENVGSMAVYGIAFPTPDPSISVKGTLPQTFLEITAQQAQRAEAV